MASKTPPAIPAQNYISVVNGPRPAAAMNWRSPPTTSCWPTTARSVSLPEVPLLAVLPGTGGLTRVVDKRKVRRDHADFLLHYRRRRQGQARRPWRLVDEIAPQSKLEGKVTGPTKRVRCRDRSAPATERAFSWPRSTREYRRGRPTYGFVSVDIDRAARTADLDSRSPESAATRRYRRDGRAGRRLLAAADCARTR